MTEQGWIKLYRCLMEKPIWQCSTPEQKVILITILMMANHEEKEWEWQGEKFTVKPGQLITSLESIKEKAGKGISIQNVRTALKKFEKYGFLTNQSTKTGRLITIVNWETYQANEKETNKDVNKELTKYQQSTNKALTTNKNDKNEKNDKKLEELVIDPFIRECFHELKQIEGYPFDYDKDLEFIQTLLVDFPQLDILEELRKWKVYKLDKPIKSKSNPRLQFRNWCRKAAEWQRPAKQKEPLRLTPAEERIKNITKLPDRKTLDEWLKSLPSSL